MRGRPHTRASSRHSVLCVDDEPELLEALALTLGQRYYVELAASGAAALEKLQAHPGTTVIVSDMRMPNMDGSRFLQESRRYAPDARRILLTGYADLSSAISAVNDGRLFRYLEKPCPSAQLIAAVDAAIADHETERQSRDAIRHDTEHALLARDRLTGLASREKLNERLFLLQTAEAEPCAPTALFLIDLADPPELLHDGDVADLERTVCEFAGRLRAQFPHAECVARYGERTFAVLLHTEQSSTRALEGRALSLIDLLGQPIEIDGLTLRIDLCVGIALVGGNQDPRAQLKHAELAMREAKHRGANSVCVYSDESAHKAEQRRELSRALRASIANQQLLLHYQPIVDLEHRRLHSIEALARWEHPGRGFVSPAVFIPLVEQMNLMARFGEWAVTRACAGTKHLLGRLCPRVSVNVSVMQLRDVNFMHGIFMALEKSGIGPTSLELEITESVFAEDLESVCQILTELRAMGIKIALDDFGAGYSSLHQLRRLPVDVVKIDGIFARDFDHGGEAIMSAALSIARSLNLEAVVEGVETTSMLRKVLDLGATKIQGYVLARPMPACQLEAWLRGREFEQLVDSVMPVTNS
jgi:predicted signal transduction protein with EAL and GGDEF domain